MIKGIKGGKLTFEKVKAITLFILNKAAKDKTNSVWNPQKGQIPIKTPKAIARDFLAFESLLCNTFSKKKSLNPFFLKLRIKIEAKISPILLG